VTLLKKERTHWFIYSWDVCMQFTGVALTQ